MIIIQIAVLFKTFVFTPLYPKQIAVNHEPLKQRQIELNFRNEEIGIESWYFWNMSGFVGECCVYMLSTQVSFGFNMALQN